MTYRLLNLMCPVISNSILLYCVVNYHYFGNDVIFVKGNGKIVSELNYLSAMT
jgi:hypothetical protein